MSLVDHLMRGREKLDLAKELARTALENAELKRKIVGLEVEVFWLRVAERNKIDESVSND